MFSCLWPTKLQKPWTNFSEIYRKCLPQDKEEIIRFWVWSKTRSGSWIGEPYHYRNKIFQGICRKLKNMCFDKIENEQKHNNLSRSPVVLSSWLKWVFKHWKLREWKLFKINFCYLNPESSVIIRMSSSLSSWLYEKYPCPGVQCI